MAVLQLPTALSNARAAFFRWSPPPTGWTLTVSQLTREPRTIAVLPLTGWVEAIGVSSDGSRAAVITNDILTVYDTRSAHALASSKIFLPSSASQLHFVSPTTVRAFLPNQRTQELYVRDFDVATRRWTPVAGPVRLANNSEYRAVGSQLFTGDRTQVMVRDLRDPSSAQTFPIGQNNGIFFMRDGRQAIYHYGEPAYVEIRGNGIQHVVRFPHEIESVRVGAELANGRLLVTTYSHTRREHYDTTTYILDPSSGTLSSPMPHVSLAVAWPSLFNAFDPEVTHRALLHRDTGKIDVIDLRTGAIRPLFP